MGDTTAVAGTFAVMMSMSIWFLMRSSNPVKVRKGFPDAVPVVQTSASYLVTVMAEKALMSL